MFKKKRFQLNTLDESLIEEIPPKVFYKFRQRFKNLTVYQVEYAAKAFLSFLSVCKAFPNMNIPMPSDSVDEIWHEFILHTRDYSEFCNKHLGRFLHHTPNQDFERKNISEKEVAEILHLWTLTCLQEDMDPFSEDSKPSLFYSDVELGIKEELPNYAKMLKRRTGLISSKTKNSFGSSQKLEEYKKQKKYANNSDPMLSTLLLVDLYLYTDIFTEAKHAAAAEASLTSCGTGSFILLNCSSTEHSNSCGGSSDNNSNHSCGGSSCGSGCGGD